MTEIIDLDAILKPAKQVRIGGHVYKLPPGIPVELFLRVNQLAREETADTEQLEDLATEILKLFQWGDPEIESLPDGMLMDQLVSLVNEVYGEASEADAPRPSRAGTRSTPPAKTRSASST